MNNTYYIIRYVLYYKILCDGEIEIKIEEEGGGYFLNYTNCSIT